MSAITEAIVKMKSRFDSKAAEGRNFVFLFEIEDDENCVIAIKNGQCDITIGSHDNPDVTLIMNLETLEKIMTNELDGMQAFMSGALRIEGDMSLATKFNELFP